MRSILLIKILLILSGLAALFWYGWSKILLPEVIVVKAEHSDLNDSVFGNAKVIASNSFDIRALSPGQVTWAVVSPNQKPVLVDQNQTLFRMDSAELDAAIKKLELDHDNWEKRKNIGSLLTLKIDAETKELDLIKELAKKSDGVASYQIEKKISHIESLKKQLRHEEQDNAHFSARYKIEAQRLRAMLDDRSIKSPIDGKVVASFVSNGSTVFVNDLLARVHSHDCLVEVLIKEEDSLGIKEGQKVILSLLSKGSTRIDAEVFSVSPIIDPQSGMSTVHLRLKSDEKIAVGSTGRAEIIRKGISGVLTIPRKSLMGDRVLIEHNGQLTLRKVRTGAGNLSKVEIIEGIKPGDRVVVSTPHLYRSGQRVSSQLASY